MDELFGHPKVILEVLVAYWLFSAIVTSMPEPPSDAFWYKWLYGTLHIFAGNVSAFAASKIQSLENSTTITTRSTQVAPEKNDKPGGQ